jgi:putative flippase GtrA
MTLIQRTCVKLLDPKILKFLVTGVLNTIFGYSVYAGLIYINRPYYIALFIATVSGVIFNYFSFGSIVFQTDNTWRIFGKFVAAYIVIYVANTLLLSMLTNSFHLNPYIGQAICIPLNVLASWLLMNLWVYKKD